jgi:hypothetical protein
MMGRSSQDQEQLFYLFNLEEVSGRSLGARHCRRSRSVMGSGAELVPHYSPIGRPSIDPVLMIRMLIVGYVFAIR